MSCSSGCPTQDHASFGECLRSKNLKVAYCQSWKGADLTRQKAGDRELDAYADAVRQGIQPATTRMDDVRSAVEESSKTGVAYRHDAPPAIPTE